MKSIFKALFFLCALSLAFPVFAQSDFDATKARAEAGDANAQNNLGAMYDNGTGVAENVQEAVKWYRLAAEQGDANSLFVLGLMYENGEGVSGNDVQAYIWYSVAAAQGAAYAEEYRDNVKGFYPVFTDGYKTPENSKSLLATLRRIRGLWNRSM